MGSRSDYPPQIISANASDARQWQGIDPRKGNRCPRMSLRTVRVWLWATLLVPAVFALAIAAVSLAAGIIPSRRPASDQSHPLGPETVARLTLPVSLPETVGGFAIITVRITTDPPAPEVLDASRGYLTALLQYLVRTLPAGWNPDEAGIAILKRAIEEAVPVAIAAKLPEGTRVAASADVTIATDAPGTPESTPPPAAPHTPATPPSP